MRLSLRVFIVSLVDIVVTDSVLYFHLKQNPGTLTPFKLVAVILITLLPIFATLALWEVQQNYQQKKSAGSSFSK